MHGCVHSVYIQYQWPSATVNFTHAHALVSGESHENISSYTVDLKALSEKVTNVKDFQFVHGYNNPTLFILYEQTPTWAG